MTRSWFPESGAALTSCSCWRRFARCLADWEESCWSGWGTTSSWVKGEAEQQKIEQGFLQVVEQASAKALQVVLVLFGSEQFWKYGASFAEFVEQMKAYVETGAEALSRRR
jgi:hypothetical protein